LNDTFYVDDLKPMFYKNKLSNREDMGFSAHEVQEVFPFLVSGEKDENHYQSVNYNGFIALLVKEIQELKKRLKTTEDQLQTVMNKLGI
jgi:flagellar biosynthesis chaperone FliJ